jgi:glucosamine--fructose-6-phosphate aminotransferase (isomerizing)
VIRGGEVEIFDSEGRLANREVKITSASAGLVDKGGYRHFMAKEIHEQPEVIATRWRIISIRRALRVRCAKPRVARRLARAHAADHLGLRHRVLCGLSANTGSR